MNADQLTNRLQELRNTANRIISRILGTHIQDSTKLTSDNVKRFLNIASHEDKQKLLRIQHNISQIVKGQRMGALGYLGNMKYTNSSNHSDMSANRGELNAFYSNILSSPTRRKRKLRKTRKY